MGKKLRVCHLFAGIGSPEMALKRLGIDFENVGFAEVDKFAIQSYKAIHGDVACLGDIEKIEELPQTDLLFYGSPCQSFSIAGSMEGLKDAQGNKTKSGVLLDVERLLERAKETNTLPKYLIMENVKNLVGTKFMPAFEWWLGRLDSFGYNNYWKVLNAKDYGVPQSRERVFVVSIRKDIDKYGYTFPEPFPLQKRLKDVLEDEVPDNYYLSGEVVAKVAKTLFNNVSEPITGATRTRYDKDGKPFQNLETTGEPISNTLTTVQTDSLVIEPRIIQVANYLEGTGNYWKNPNNGRIYSKEGLSPTINTMEGGNRQPKVLLDNTLPIRVRKLTERECWRLMGVSDVDTDKVKAIKMSRSQMYKQAGNSIVVDVLYYIFKNLDLTR